jgi:hypothetical protein
MVAMSVSDNLGNGPSTDSATYRLDNTARPFGACTGGPFLLNSGSHNVSITADDGSGSGLGGTLNGSFFAALAGAA